jgi:CheY-like chemotaxis protein
VAQAETILLAEDDSDDVLFIGMAFEQAGFKSPLVVVNDGTQAIEYLKGNGIYADRARFPNPTLLVLDLHLPRASGFEVLEWIRQRPEWMALPIIILTSSINGADMKRAYDLGANFFLSKPVKFDDLVQTIRDLGAYGLSDAFLSVPGPFAVPQAAPRGASPVRRLSEG